MEPKEVLEPSEEVEPEGIEIPQFLPSRVKIGRIKLSERREALSLTYPLIPRHPAKGEVVFAHARIFWDQKANRYVYQVVEPPLTKKLKEIIKKVKELPPLLSNFMFYLKNSQ